MCCSHLQRLYPGGNEVTYHPNLSTFLRICWKKPRPWPSLIDVLDHCQLCEQETIFIRSQTG